jgi:hypothetical protein
VRWGVARRIVWAWIFTIPASAVLAASAALLITAGPLAVMFAALILGAVTLVWVARRVSSRKRSAPIDDEGSDRVPKLRQ